MQETTKPKWYENKTLIIILFFVLPPLGIYGMTKRKSISWKKALYIIPASLLTFFTIVGVFGAMFIDYYKDGIDYYNKQDYIKAYDNLKMVSADNKDYNDAILKIKEIKPIVDSLIAIKKNNKDVEYETEKSISEIDIVKLKAFQRKWADSLIKDWNGNYVINNNITEKGDTIYFQLNKVASKGNGNINTSNKITFQKDYDSLLVKNFGKQPQIFKTTISLLLDREQEKENKILAERNRKIQMQFSAWNGSHDGLKRLVKENMHDPSSFDHIETIYADKGKYILVQMKYRGKNAFGAKVINISTAKVDLDGNILSVE